MLSHGCNREVKLEAIVYKLTREWGWRVGAVKPLKVIWCGGVRPPSHMSMSMGWEAIQATVSTFVVEVCYGVVGCDVMWCGVVWCGVVWCDVVTCGVVC